MYKSDFHSHDAPEGKDGWKKITIPFHDFSSDWSDFTVRRRGRFRRFRARVSSRGGGDECSRAGSGGRKPDEFTNGCFEDARSFSWGKLDLEA